MLCAQFAVLTQTASVYLVLSCAVVINSAPGKALLTPSCLPLLNQVPVALVHEVLSTQPGTANLASRYDNYALRSFVEDNRSMVWCTGRCSLSFTAEVACGWCG